MYDTIRQVEYACGVITPPAWAGASLLSGARAIPRSKGTIPFFFLYFIHDYPSVSRILRLLLGSQDNTVKEDHAWCGVPYIRPLIV